MRALTITIVGAAMLLSQGCSVYQQGAPTESEYRASHPQPQVSTPERVERVFAGARALHICSKTADVRKLLGDPDFGTRTLDSSGRDSAVRWVYVLRENSERNIEQGMEITLNSSRQVISIMPISNELLPFAFVTDGPGCNLR